MTGHPGVIVTLDGEVHPPGTPLLFADDLAAVRGDGVFETLLVRDGGACLVESHLGRLSHSAKLMDLPEPDLSTWRRASDLAARQGAGDVIFISSDGYVLEGPRSTVVIATDGEGAGGDLCFLTPPPWYPI